MDAFTIRIADLVARVHPLFESTREYCRAYLSDQEPDLTVTVTEDDLILEQELAEQEALEEGLRIRKFTGPFLERAVIQRKIAQELLMRDTLLVHGSAVSLDGAVYLFTAACGTGKSTHTRLWREVFGQRAVMINDDKPFLQVTSDGVLASGSPWSGKHGLDTNVSLPLRGICILRRGAENVIRPIKPEDAIAMLQHQSFAPADPTLQTKMISLVDRLSHCVPLWEMECTKDPQAALVSYRAMSGNG